MPGEGGADAALYVKMYVYVTMHKPYLYVCKDVYVTMYLYM